MCVSEMLNFLAATYIKLICTVSMYAEGILLASQGTVDGVADGLVVSG